MHLAAVDSLSPRSKPKTSPIGQHHTWRNLIPRSGPRMAAPNSVITMYHLKSQPSVSPRPLLERFRSVYLSRLPTYESIASGQPQFLTILSSTPIYHITADSGTRYGQSDFDSQWLDESWPLDEKSTFDLFIVFPVFIRGLLSSSS